MKNTCLIIATLVACFACTPEKSGEQLIQEYDELVSNNQSVSYKVKKDIKYFSGDDTSSTEAQVELIRDSTDTIFGGKFWIQRDSSAMYYNGLHAFFINERNRKIIRYFPHEGQDWVIYGNVNRSLVHFDFLKEKSVLKYLTDTNVTVEIIDSNSADFNGSIVQVKYIRDDEDFKHTQSQYWFNHAPHLEKQTYQVQFQGNWQYDEWNWSKFNWGTVNSNSLETRLDSFKSLYSLEDYVPNQQGEPEPLANGTQVPSFTGFHFQQKDSIVYNGTSDKYTILDFWYKDCYPCIKAIPALNELLAKYGEDKLQILGINPYDSEEKEKIQKFIDYNKMQYPAILTTKAVAKAYDVSVYPTLYIVDKDGKVRYGTLGYGEPSKSKLDSVLSLLIN